MDHGGMMRGEWLRRPIATTSVVFVRFIQIQLTIETLDRAIAADRELKDAAQSSGLAIIDPDEQQTMSDAGAGAREGNGA
jgi:hypothetical protein